MLSQIIAHLPMPIAGNRCWICGSSTARTREHRIKASDLRATGALAKGTRAYLHDATRRNRLVQGIQSDLLKFEHRICEGCNSRLTQPYDRAWQEVMAFLAAYPPTSARQRFNRIFPYETRWRMLDMHLFFVKHFGCRIAEGNVPIDLEVFSMSLRQRKAHPSVFLTFVRDSTREDVVLAQGSDLRAGLVDGTARVAGYFYSVGPVTVHLMYAEPDHQDRVGLRDAWHPSGASTSIRFVDFAQWN